MKSNFIVFLVGSILAFSTIQAQENGSLEGTVRDVDGEPLPIANVVVQGPVLETVMGATTDLDGNYHVGSVPPGTFQVIVSYIGYREVIRSGVQIRSGQRVKLDFILQPEAFLLNQRIISASRRPEKVLEAPASVAVLEAEEVRDRAVLGVADYAKELPGVDFAQTGMAQNNTVVRGFNNVFSGALLTLVDNRIARVPSLRFNANNFIPLTGDDIERIEVILGPGSALYGPNSANGVMHIITRSPFRSQGTSLSVGGGERSLRKFSLRHAGTLNDKVGYKLSGQYYAGTDWKYVDPEEVRLQGSNPRTYDLERSTGELRFDFRPTDDLELILAGGYTDASNIDMTGLGAAQADGWTCSFLQSRLRYKGWFAQVFHNMSDAGNTKLLRSGNPIVDKSKLTVFQVQHSAGIGERQHFTYGLDALWTRPDTKGTINGVNESQDDVDEYGFYVQSETALNEYIDLVLAGRIDDHIHIDDPVFSPRAAIVVKPTPTQTVRFTYNRAFSTPTSNNLFLDLNASPDAFAVPGFSPMIDVRTQGSTSGFRFRRDGSELPMFRSAFSPAAGLSVDQYISLHDPMFTNVMWQIGSQVVLGGFKAEATGAIAQQLEVAGVPSDQALEQAQQQVDPLAGVLEGILPTILPGLQNSLGTLNQETRGFDPVGNLASAVKDISKIEPTITETFEAGIRGVVEDRLLLTADVYRTKTKDFVGPLRVETPNVFLEATSLSSALSSAFSQVLQDPSFALQVGALSALDAPSLGGNGNGSSVDELTGIFVAAASIPFGTVSAEEATDPAAVMLTYRNFGQVIVYGADLGFAFYANPDLTITGNYSYVSKDLFPNLDGIGDIALNAPRHKINAGVRYNLPNTGFRLGGRVRFRDAFPMSSGVYVGPVESYAILDLNASYELPVSQATLTLSLEVGNVLDKSYRAFIGAPEIGRLAVGSLTVRF